MEAVQEADPEEAPQELADKDVADDHLAETIISIRTTNTTPVRFALIMKTEDITPIKGLDTLQAVTAHQVMTLEEGPRSPDQKQTHCVRPLSSAQTLVAATY